MADFEKTGRTTVVRKPDRGRYDRATVYAILDEALICHVGIVEDGRPVVIPTAHWRDGDRLYVHGSRASRLLRAMGDGAEVCVTVTLLDGLVLARSGFHHSMNYRSVVIFGKADPVRGRAGKVAALRAFMERLAPGRWDELRPPTDKEIAATEVMALPLVEASAKVRTGGPPGGVPPTTYAGGAPATPGGPVDAEADYAHPVWAGNWPIVQSMGEPVPDARLAPGIALPAYLRHGRG